MSSRNPSRNPTGHPDPQHLHTQQMRLIANFNRTVQRRRHPLLDPHGLILQEHGAERSPYAQRNGEHNDDSHLPALHEV